MSLPDKNNPVVQALRNEKVWVCWRRVEKDGREMKIPVNPRTGRAASVTNSDDFSSFAEAIGRCHHVEDVDGVGVVFTENMPYSGVDFDKCLDAERRALNGTEKLLERFPTYTEVSPSGTGLHSIGFGKLKQRKGLRGQINGHDVEVYSSDRYFTLTGDVLPGSSDQLGDIQKGLDWASKQIGGKVGGGATKRRGGVESDSNSSQERRNFDPQNFESWLEDAERGLALYNKQSGDPMAFALGSGRMCLSLASGFDHKDAGWSPSQFDLAFMNELALADMAYPQAIAACMEARQASGNDVKPRPDYWARTVVAVERHPYLVNRRAQEARGDSKQADDKPGDDQREVARMRIHEMTGHWIDKIEKYIAETGPIYKMYIGAAVQQFGADVLTSSQQRPFQRIVQAMTDKFCPIVSKENYEVLRRYLLQLVISIDTGSESTERGEGALLFKRYMAEQSAPAAEISAEKIDNGAPLIWRGDVWIKRDKFEDYITRQLGKRIVPSALNRLMIAAGSRKHKIAVKTEDGRISTRDMWEVPAIAKEDDDGE